MSNILGSGVEALVEFVKKCRAAGGTPMLRTGYGGVEFEDKLVVACWGEADKVPGGTITNIPKQLIDKCRETKGDYKYLEQWLQQLGYA